MKSPSLSLDEYFLTRLQVEFTAPSNTPTVTVTSVTCNFDYHVFNHPVDQQRRMLQVKVEFQQLDDKQQKVGYHIQCEVTGFFSFTESTPKGKEEIVIRVNGFNLLYGALRGVLATTTAVFPGGRFNLPNVMPNEVVEDIERRREEARRRAESTLAAPPA